MNCARIFFRERAFLPQSLLGQLLQIYQDASSDAASPLANFVSELLGLGRLDALEAGLQPLADVRNVRRIVHGWQAAENEIKRLDRLISEQKSNRNRIDEKVLAAVDDLAGFCALLELSVEVQEGTLKEVAVALSESDDSTAFALLTDQQRLLASIQREIDVAKNEASSSASEIAADAQRASIAFSQWDSEYGQRVSSIRSRVETFLPNVSLPNDPEQFAEVALTRLRTDENQYSKHVSQARSDIARFTVAQDELDVALRNRGSVDQEVARLSGSAGSLGLALAELTSFISDEICPACDRNFSEVSELPLSKHVHDKVLTLSASAERLLTVGRTRSELQVNIDRLNREIDAIAVRKFDEKSLAELDRRLASFSALINELEALTGVLSEGGRLREADVTMRRAVSRVQSRQASLAAAFATLSEFAILIGAPALEESEPFETGAARLDKLLLEQLGLLEERLAVRRKGVDLIAIIHSEIAHREKIDALISSDMSAWQTVDQALSTAGVLRSDGNAVRGAVDRVRSGIIRREFNDRLNLLWRDLFVRLAPGEPFIPAFRVPESSTQRLQPKLITEHRDAGDVGGTPGAMLSAGNLNTAALTLFIALHLSMPKELPWLILDDPVQSMDDVHIAHFAALLRTLSKEHGRQIVIAVHDRQLFEYLTLELSPAFLEDSLLTLELSRGRRRDSVCVSRRYSFQEETAFLAIA